MNPTAREASAVRLLPPSLDIYVTNRCNMRCGYCSSRGILDTGPARSLRASDMARAADMFVRLIREAQARGADPAPARTIAFTGGEPLLEFADLA
ncbi:MAG: hypothetical protein PHF00_02890, partial [Elusimicrobia bacterium]|nr:hypothetical protein [Elusimicrobiota bacterium]